MSGSERVYDHSQDEVMFDDMCVTSSELCIIMWKIERSLSCTSGVVNWLPSTTGFKNRKQSLRKAA